MHSHILRKVMIATLTLLVGAGSMIFATKQSYADVKIGERYGLRAIFISNTITKDDANYFAQHMADYETGSTWIWLNSTGGDVNAAMQIGRIIRKYDMAVSVNENEKCFSSCVLLYIASISKNNFGVIGLHRPYFAFTPQGRQEVERQVPLMLQKLKSYVQEMGVTDIVYQEMVNTEPSDIKLYWGDEIKKLIPERDPTFDEVMTSYDARQYGVSNTSEMRIRNKEFETCNLNQLKGGEKIRTDCRFLLWGLSELVFSEREKQRREKCKPETELWKSLKIKEVREHPTFLNFEACQRSIMLGR